MTSVFDTHEKLNSASFSKSQRNNMLGDELKQIKLFQEEIGVNTERKHGSLDTQKLEKLKSNKSSPKKSKTLRRMETAESKKLDR